MKNKINIKIFFSINLFVFFIYLFISIFYIKNNINIYVPEKEHEEHLGIFTGVSNDIVDNSINFLPGKKWTTYNISPGSGDDTGPLQIYHIESKDNNKKDNQVLIAYFQRDNTTDINIEIMSLNPPDMSVKEMTWFLDDWD